MDQLEAFQKKKGGDYTITADDLKNMFLK